MGVDIIFKIAAIGLLTAVINILLKKSDKDEIATLTTIASLVLVLIIVIDMIVRLFEIIRNLFEF
ncbi:MAG: stage III sporulation protein AC [Clostridia bacterium]